MRFTAEQFEAVYQANPDAVLELDASGHVVHMTSTGSETGARNSTLLILLGLAFAQLGWLLIPEQQAVEVWPASGGGDPLRIDVATSLDAGSLFPGLQIDLLEIWQG